MALISPALLVIGATSAKAERLLGWRTRPIEDTVAETAESLLAHGVGA